MRRSLHTLQILVLLAASLYAQDSTYIQWDQPQRISADPYISAIPRVRAQGNCVYLMWVTGNTSYSHFTRSTNFGVTWEASRLIGDTTTGFRTNNMYEVDASTIYFVTDWTDLGPPVRYWLWGRKSSDRGITWEEGHSLFEGSLPTIAMKESVIVLSYEASGIDRPRFAVSSDIGGTWSFFPRTPSSGPMPNNIALANSRLLLTRVGVAGGEAEVKVSNSTDYGANWMPEQFVSTIDGLISDEPYLTVDSSGHAYAVWRDAKYGTSTGYGATILLRRSTDFGTTWQEEQILTTIPSGLQPKVSANGTFVGVAWDNEVYQSSTLVRRVHARVSSNFGETWGPEYDLTPGTSGAGDCDIVIVGDLIHVAWEDAVGGVVNLEIFYRRGRMVTTGLRVSDDYLFPFATQLLQNYPNPFNSQTEFQFGLARTSIVTIDIIDLLGKTVRTLTMGKQNSGWHTIQWDGKNERGADLPSGLYFVRLFDQENIVVRKAILLR